VVADIVPPGAPVKVNIPPAELSVIVVTEAPLQIVIPPVIGLGVWFTVTVYPTAAPAQFGVTYEMVVTPPDTPNTTPVADTVPTAGLVLLQVPPGVPLPSARV
jgi:hypothetical protein